jgi:enamine deaminase RidA (YjgF/YER057c/UK114 family)
MHYAFDCWMKRTYPQCAFVRYADDAVVHCRTQAQAEAVMRSIALRLEECGLAMNPDKSGVVYCKDSNRTGAYSKVQFTFLGFTFRPREALNSRYRRRFTSFLPAVSSAALKRMRQAVRDWRIHRRTSLTLENLAQQCNPIIRNWVTKYISSDDPPVAQNGFGGTNPWGEWDQQHQCEHARCAWCSRTGSVAA